MSFQHGPGLWVKKETERLSKLSAEFVKGAVQPSGSGIHDQLKQHEDRSQTDNTSAMAMDIILIVPEALQKGVMMTKILAEQQKRLVFQLDPDEGRILYKSTEHSGGALSLFISDLYVFLFKISICSSY